MKGLNCIRSRGPHREGRERIALVTGSSDEGDGADVATVQALMRHANASVTMDRYVQAVTPAKRQAQRGIVGLLDPNGPTELTETSVTA